MQNTEPSLDESRESALPTGRSRAGISALPFTALGGQPAWEPAELERFVGAARIAVMAYVRHDGRPGQAPIWYVYRDGRFHLNVSTGSPKHRALQRDPRVCVTIQDERPPYRAVIFDSVAELSDQSARTATAGIEDRYFGRIGGRAYRQMSEAEFAETGHTEIELRPTQVRGFDNTRNSTRPRSGSCGHAHTFLCCAGCSESPAPADRGGRATGARGSTAPRQTGAKVFEPSVSAGRTTGQVPRTDPERVHGRSRRVQPRPSCGRP